MSKQPKIKINDCSTLRQELYNIYDNTSQLILAKWALELAKHIMQITSYLDSQNESIKQGFAVNEAWQKGDVRMHDVRQAGFKIHALARAQRNETNRTILRVVGQAVGTGHMREHAMVASDYAIKVINLIYPNDEHAIIKERQWQIDSLLEEIGKPKFS